MNVKKTEAFRKKKILVLTSVDYTKAYDAIKRDTIIDTLIYYEIDGKIIDTVAEIYQNDITNVKLRSEIEVKFDITNGIRQGCNLSLPYLDTLILFRISYPGPRQCAAPMPHSQCSAGRGQTIN